MRESNIAKFLIPFGAIFIFFGIVMFIMNNNSKNYVETKATVINVDEKEEINVDDSDSYITTTYDVTISYKVDDKEYTQVLNNVSKYKIGDKIVIYYNPSNPNQTIQNKSLVLPIVTLIVGIISLTGGIIKIVITKK